MTPSYYQLLSSFFENQEKCTEESTKTTPALQRITEKCSKKDVLDIIQRLQPTIFSIESEVGVLNGGNVWKCWNDWQKDGKINFDYFRKHFGHVVVPVVKNGNSYGSGDVEHMKMSEYLNYLENPASETLYLKDFHYQLIPEMHEYRQDSIHFQPDLLNAYWDHVSGRKVIACTNNCPDSHQFNLQLDIHTSDYRFLYFGPISSTTPLHTDVIKSHSWSTNIAGNKEWWLVSPDQEDKMISLGLLHVEGHENTVILQHCDLQDLMDTLQVIKFTQSPGETVFIPSGWWHQVKNVTHPTLSINCNWFTPYSLIHSHVSLEHDLLQSQASIKDSFPNGWNQIQQKVSPKEYSEETIEFLNHSQTILRAQAGIDWEEWIRVLLWFSCASTQLENGEYANVTRSKVYFIANHLYHHDAFIRLCAFKNPNDNMLVNLRYLMNL